MLIFLVSFLFFKNNVVSFHNVKKVLINVNLLTKDVTQEPFIMSHSSVFIENIY